MDLSDDIAYSVHDFEDAIVNGYLDPARLAGPRRARRRSSRRSSRGSASTSPAMSWPMRCTASTSLPEWIGSFDGSRPAHARLKNLTSDLIGRFARAATAATREAFPTAELTRYRAHVVVPRVVEAEMAVLKGTIGAAVVIDRGPQGAVHGSSAGC